MHQSEEREREREREQDALTVSTSLMSHGSQAIMKLVHLDQQDLNG